MTEPTRVPHPEFIPAALRPPAGWVALVMVSGLTDGDGDGRFIIGPPRGSGRTTFAERAQAQDAGAELEAGGGYTYLGVAPVVAVDDERLPA